ncbi:MAG: aminopeptidase [Candidatus Latescibacterota bacterium]|nr:MAG: aminopeptidase [Candidatus Latescibacterota bacterium]
MKVYIVTDLEGISGICLFEQTREKIPPLYEEARLLLTREVNAAVQGCLDAGAEEVVVLDGHGGGFNFVPEEMHPGAYFITGPGRPHPLLGLDESFGAVLCIGFHAKLGTPDGVLHHTQSSKAETRYWYNGIEMGEIGQVALIAGAYGVPVAMVTGDLAACREARELLGEDIVTVKVKEGYGRHCAKMLPPKRAREEIRKGAREAVMKAPSLKPFILPLPIEGKLMFGDKEYADNFKPKKARRIDERTFVATFHSALEILTF